MKIAILSPEYPPEWGGLGVHSYHLAKTLHSFGHEVHIISRGNGNCSLDQIADGIFLHKVSWLKIPILSSLSFGKNSVNKLVDLGNDFDIVHIQCPATLMNCKTIKRIKSPIIITMHGTWKGERNALNGECLKNLKLGDLAIYLTWPINENYEKIMLKNTMAVITVSKYCVQELAQYKIPRRMLFNKLSVIPNGVDTKTFKPCKYAYQLLRDKYNLAKSDIIILSVARLAARKGFIDLLLAFEKIKTKIINAKLIIVGNGPMELSLKRLAKKLEISEQVIFVKGLTAEELQMHYAGCDLFTLPSYYEGLGIVYLEAMASGIPIVATNSSAIPETVHNCKNGILVNVHAPKELADAIINLLLNEGMRRIMGENGREIAVKEYDWDIIVGRIEKLYKSLIEA